MIRLGRGMGSPSSPWLDAQAIQFESSRARRPGWGGPPGGPGASGARPAPHPASRWLEQAAKARLRPPRLAPPELSAVMVRVAPGTRSPGRSPRSLSGWADVTVLRPGGTAGAHLLQGSVEKVRPPDRACSAILLTIIAAVIMALILYTLTLDKLRSIALLKLIGALNNGDPGADPATGPGPRRPGLRHGLPAGSVDFPGVPAGG